jgi:hypothetical protein
MIQEITHNWLCHKLTSLHGNPNTASFPRLFVKVSQSFKKLRISQSLFRHVQEIDNKIKQRKATDRQGKVEGCRAGYESIRERKMKQRWEQKKHEDLLLLALVCEENRPDIYNNVIFFWQK